MSGLNDASWKKNHDAEVVFPTIDGRGTDHIMIRGRELRLRSDLGFQNYCTFDFSGDDFVDAVEDALQGSASTVQVELPQIDAHHEVEVSPQFRGEQLRIVVTATPNGPAKTRLRGKVLDLSVRKAREIIRSYDRVNNIS